MSQVRGSSRPEAGATAPPDRPSPGDGTPMTLDEQEQIVYEQDDAQYISPPLDRAAAALQLSPYSATSSALPSPVVPSPRESPLLRSAETLEGLARQLGDLNEELSTDEDSNGDSEGAWRCCCGAASGCRTARWRERTERKLKLSGEIGNALLQRSEALERKHEREVDRLRQQLSTKQKALADSVVRLRALEKGKEMDIQRFADITKRYEALEKRYTQAMHTQTLTQQSLTHVRSELTSLRKTNNRQSLALASGAEVEDRLIELERRYEEARDTAELEGRSARDEQRKRKRAEDRIAELEERLKASEREKEEIKEARARDAQDLLINAKERLATLHDELSETFKKESMSDEPEYQKALEDLVANNALLRHDTAELSHLLAESRDEARALRDEIDELRAAGADLNRVSPAGFSRPRLASELSQGSIHHSRTESSPNVGTIRERQAWARMSVSSGGHAAATASGGGRTNPWDHQRRVSLAPSFASASTGTGDIVLSPGLGIGGVGEYGGSISSLNGGGALSPTLVDGRDSPVASVLRTSPNGGIGYVLNGVPKKAPAPAAARPSASVRRTYSIDRRGGPSRSMSGGVDATIPEGLPSPREEGSGYETIDEPLSPNGSSSGYFRAAEISRKRRSLMLSRRDSYSPNMSMDASASISSAGVPGRHSHAAEGSFDSASGQTTMVDQQTLAKLVGGNGGGHAGSGKSQTASPKRPTISPAKKRVQRRTLMLLSRSQGVQTDPPADDGPAAPGRVPIDLRAGEGDSSERPTPMVRTDTLGSRSETSSLHQPSQSMMLLLVEHLAKLLVRLQNADIPTLNKRLKKQHLPGADVGLLSQSTLRTLQQDVADLRYAFRGLLEQTVVGRKEFNQLLKLLKDVFSELIDLQALVNDVTIDPSLAKKLQKEAYRDVRAEDEAAAKKAAGAAGATGLGWIAAPITKFFVTPAADAEQDRAGAGSEAEARNSSARPGRLDRGRLQPTVGVGSGGPGTGGSVRAPKQAAITSATTTHISVEFGGAGIVRKITPAPAGPPSTSTASAAQTSILDDSPLPPSVSRMPSQTLGSATAAADRLAPESARTKTLRPSKSRANRSELLGIFAGANQGSSSTGPVPPRLRGASSQYFAQQQRAGTASTQSRQVPVFEDRKKLSAAVDAVIDSTAQQMEADDPDRADQPFEALLERTLRPRGLSDSSIRTTFLSDADRTAPASTDAAPPAARPGGYGGMFGIGAVTRRWYSYGTKDGAKTPTPEAAAAPAVAPDTDAMSTHSVAFKASGTDGLSERSTREPSPLLVVSSATSSARPIPVSSPAKGAGQSLSISLSASPTTKGSSPNATGASSGGLLSMLASSLAVSPGHYAGLGAGMDAALGEDDGAGTDDDLMVASLRQGGFGAPGARRPKARSADRWT